MLIKRNSGKEILDSGVCALELSSPFWRKLTFVFVQAKGFKTKANWMNAN